MVKKSAVKLVGQKDAAQSIEREFLSIANPDDAQKIYYDYEQQSSPPPKAAPSTPAPAAPVKAAAAPAPAPVPATPPPVAAAAVPQPSVAPSSVDKPFTPTDIVIALVAQKLRRAFDQIPVSDSIQTLSAGRSNEVPRYQSQ
jgi:fatty acid synthase subunit alpha, fungi type